MAILEIKQKFEDLAKKWGRLFELLQAKRLSKESVAGFGDVDMDNMEKLKALAKLKLKKPAAAKLAQIKKREKLRSIGLALFGKPS